MTKYRLNVLGLIRKVKSYKIQIVIPVILGNNQLA